MGGEQNPVVRVFRKDPRARLPHYATGGAAGLDLEALITEDVLIPPLGRTRLPTGLVFEIPEGWEAQVRPRSGLAHRSGLTVLNSPGTIDSDFRGELEILLINLGTEPFTVHRGDRIAQLVITPVSRAAILETGTPSETQRGTGGFGSTGIAADAGI